MYSYHEGLPKRGAKAEAAYQRAKAALISAWGQGVRQEPLSRDALAVALIAEGTHSCLRGGPNVVREKYQRGLACLPFDG